jgi:hypothetical protein
LNVPFARNLGRDIGGNGLKNARLGGISPAPAKASGIRLV